MPSAPYVGKWMRSSEDWILENIKKTKVTLTLYVQDKDISHLSEFLPSLSLVLKPLVVSFLGHLL